MEKDREEFFDEFKNKDEVIGYWQADVFMFGLISSMKVIYKLIRKGEIDNAISFVIVEYNYSCKVNLLTGL